MSTTQQTSGHESVGHDTPPLEQLLTCMTCAQPLPHYRQGENLIAIEPHYFAQSSISFTAKNEHDRLCETLDRLTQHMHVLSSAMWEHLRLSEFAEDKAKEDVFPWGRSHYLEEVRKLCWIMSDLSDEAKQRMDQLHTWVLKEIEAEEKKAA